MNSTTQNTLTEENGPGTSARFAVPLSSRKLSSGVIWNRLIYCHSGTVSTSRIPYHRGDRQPGDTDGHLDHLGTNIHGQDRTDLVQKKIGEKTRKARRSCDCVAVIFGLMALS